MSVAIRMLSKDKILNIINSQMEKLATDFSVNQVGLFGSAVRGELTEQSDIDILVDFAEPTFDHYMDLKFYLEKLLMANIDLVIKDSVKPRLKSTISREVIYAK